MDRFTVEETNLITSQGLIIIMYSNSFKIGLFFVVNITSPSYTSIF